MQVHTDLGHASPRGSARVCGCTAGRVRNDARAGPRGHHRARRRDARYTRRWATGYRVDDHERGGPLFGTQLCGARCVSDLETRWPGVGVT